MKNNVKWACSVLIVIFILVISKAFVVIAEGSVINPPWFMPKEESVTYPSEFALEDATYTSEYIETDDGLNESLINISYWNKNWVSTEARMPVRKPSVRFFIKRLSIMLQFSIATYFIGRSPSKTNRDEGYYAHKPKKDEPSNFLDWIGEDGRIQRLKIPMTP